MLTDTLLPLLVKILVTAATVVAASVAAELLGREEPVDKVAALFHGGPFCSDGFAGDPSQIG